MAVVGDIVISVFADVGPLVREMDRAKAAVSGFAAGAASKLDRFGSAATALGNKLSIVTAAMTAAAGAAFALTKSAADAGDKIANSSRAVGVSAEYYQEMAFAVGQVADVTEDDFAKALTLLNRKLGEAQQGSASAIKAFEAVGITEAEIAAGTVTTEGAFDALVARLGEVKDPAVAAAIATDLLGRQGARMGGLLSGASGEVASLRDRARDLGIVMSDEAVAASEQFGGKMTELQRSMQGLQVKIATVLLPVLVDTLIPALTDTVIPAIGQVIEKVGEWIQWFQDLPGPIQEAAGIIAGIFAVGGPILVGVGLVSSAFGALVAASGPIGLFVAAAATAIAAWQLWGDDIKAAVGGAIDWISQKFQGFLDMLQSIIDKAVAVKNAIRDAFSGGSLDPMGDAPTIMQDKNPQAGWMNDRFGSGQITGGPGGSMSAQMMGANVVNGMVLGALQAMQAGEETLRGVFGRVPAIAREVLQINSPSVVMQQIGGYIGEGLARGIGDSQALVADAMRSVGGTAVAEGENTVSSILGSMSTLFQGSKKFALAQAVVNIGQGLSEALKLPFPKNLAAFAATAARGAQALSSIRSASPGGGGSLPGGGAGGGAATAAPSAPPQPLEVRVAGLSADQFYSGSVVNGLLDAIRKAGGDRGMQILVAEQ